MKSILDSLHKVPAWLVGILALVMILRIPSLFEPYYYGDEMIYMTLGTGVRQGAVLYKDLHDNKPPLLYLTAAVAGNLFWFKAILAFWSLATIFVFWKLAEKLFSKNLNAIKISTFIFAILTTIPLFEGNIANAELFMIGPTILAFYILLSKELSFKNLFISGILFSMASLFKIPAAFEVPTIVFYWLITDIKNWKTIIKNTIILSVGFAVPILLTFVWYFARGAFHEYLVAAYLQNLGYVKSWTIRDVPITYRAAVVGFGMLILWLGRNKLSKKFIFICLWTLFALFGVVLSGRPYPHYFIQAMAALSLLFAVFFVDKTIEQSLAVVPLALMFFVPFYYKFWFYPTVSYYQRFINFASGRITKQQYFSSFNEKTPRNYEVASFLVTSSKVSDRVFMWDPDSSAVYSLARRLPPIKYVADYHVNDYSSVKETVTALDKTLPKFIILTDAHPMPEVLPLIKDKYLLIDRIEDASIYSRIDLQ